MLVRTGGGGIGRCVLGVVVCDCVCGAQGSSGSQSGQCESLSMFSQRVILKLTDRHC